MKIINEEIVAALSEQFVASQKGCYREYVSDKYLAAQLKHTTWRNINYWRIADIPHVLFASTHRAGLEIFEDILEIDCKSGIIGLDRANEYALLFIDYKL